LGSVRAIFDHSNLGGIISILFEYYSDARFVTRQKLDGYYDMFISCIWLAALIFDSCCAFSKRCTLMDIGRGFEYADRAYSGVLVEMTNAWALTAIVRGRNE
jgi:hypothetical protein